MKKIIIGIDVSKENLDATAICEKNSEFSLQSVAYSKFENRPMGFKRMLVWARKLVEGVDLSQILFCCETTGGYDRALCEYIFAKGYDIWRESALQIKRSAGVQKGKNDKNDSLTIAEYAMRHMDKAVLYVSPDRNIVQIKQLFLYRVQLVKEKTAKSVRVSEIKCTAQKSKALSFIIRETEKRIRHLKKEIVECEKRIVEIIDSDENLKRNYSHLNSIKGISIVNATALIVYTNNFRNITSGRKLASYYGVAPFREQSGTSIDRKINTASFSNHMLKSYIIQAATSTITPKGIYRQYYTRMIQKGKHHNLVMNNIANKLLILAMALIKSDRDFEFNHEYIREFNKSKSA